MAAILAPDYLKDRTADAPSGHRFQMYLGGWDLNAPDSKKRFEKVEALDGVLKLGDAAKSQAKALRERQRRLAFSLAERAVIRPAKTLSPFVTGVGIEHPVENGFAFLAPYGLPYLPGSGIKGVLRRAAEELALGPAQLSQGWDLLKLWRLFGFEDSSYFEREIADDGAARRRADELARSDKKLVAALRESLGQDEADAPDPLFELCTQAGSAWRRGLQWRGALVCWDAFLAPAKDELVIEILTPHHKTYFENAATPADCEPPVPVPFLAVPAGSELDLIVSCDSARLSDELKPAWKALLCAALEHACKQLGFGAKTAVGYGALGLGAALEPPKPAPPPRPATFSGAERVQAFLKLSPEQQCVQGPSLIAELKRLDEWQPEGDPAKDKKVKRTLQVQAALKDCPPA